MNIISSVLITIGLIFFLGGSIGIIRLPDFYSRLHASGMLDTMGLFLSMLGLAVLVIHDLSIGSIIGFIKIMLIVVFIYITSPTATHSIVDAGIRAGLEPWEKNKQKGEQS